METEILSLNTIACAQVNVCACMSKCTKYKNDQVKIWPLYIQAYICDKIIYTVINII